MPSIKDVANIAGVAVGTVSRVILAANYIERARRQGIRVPEDVKVIGYDGIQDHPYFHPILSTIRQPVEEMARMTIRLLYKKIEGETLDQQVYRLPVVFKQGETT
ncbi:MULTISPECIES: substrate-binding domain-containing protein [Paenibacillus]|uniref:substrate-binding domain-containing protein n=1 Tax=Paenibacillus TaxID=44249 RepID=UPI001C650B7D|nr:MULTISPECIES: substrate-binding domain-containing protein [Paenibacillus]QYK66428.1 HTH-type transcriptional repressor PurR [Paenibacillus sp. S02]